ncbi:competence protein ComFA [Salirhabdus euzebyi]|uniref:Competence protein ComFA n=1 Tax=Salirhabdus euzebyi TaxID=394506 RepID=A0A841Q5H4_9BACI|nr:helicase-related protein [Salirhabdus euzebyi]MBB6453634.1 competence protein ComFA [Salirhabdus euzebyi]
MNIKNPTENPSNVYAAHLSGKILLRNEIPFTETEIEMLLNQKFLNEIRGIEDSNFGYRCVRCGNQKRYLIGRIPTKTGKQIYCRNCIEMGRVSTFEPLYKWAGPELPLDRLKNPCAWEGQLTVHQKIASDKINEAMTNRTKLLTWAVCGAGKTEMLFRGLTDAISRGDRICLATPRADVVRELVPRFRKAFPEVSITALYGGSPDKDDGCQFVISTTHQLFRYERAFDVMIIDEADAFPFYADASLVYAAKKARKESSSLIFLTATPRKWIKLQSACGFLPTVFVPSRYHGHPLPVPTFPSCYSLKKSLQKDKLPPKINDWIAEKERNNRRFLLFVPSIEMAEQISKLTKYEYVHADDPDRIEKVECFRKGEITALITTTILERGVTFPSIDVAVIDAGHNVFDVAALVQIAGRAGRNAKDPYGDVSFFHQGKSDAMVGAVKMIEMMNNLAKERVK